MSTSENNTDSLEQIWSMMISVTFDEFIKYHVGFTENSVPECYGSGDGRSYCVQCPWRATC